MSAPLVTATSVLLLLAAPDADRGKIALLTTPVVPASWPRSAYDEVWKRWGVKTRPANYDSAFRERYGLHTAPFENDGLPMGLRAAKSLLGDGIANDCLLCHAGSIAGESIIGLGNSSLDMQLLMEELWGVSGVRLDSALSLSYQRGTIEVDASITYLMQFRDAELNRRIPRTYDLGPPLLVDIPAWWLLKKKKKRMLHTGLLDSRAVRPFLTFMLSPIIPGEDIKKAESIYADVLAYVRSIEAPRFPFEIDRKLADDGEELFRKHCSRCHGTYGDEESYPSRRIPLEEVGTDPVLAEASMRETPAHRHFLSSWFARETWADAIERDHTVPGYQAPPLDGVWATAPYFHNGSVPTVAHVLDSDSRPRVWTRTYRTDKDDYDKARLGWKITVIDGDPPADAEAKRSIYDTTLDGRGNMGHNFGDDFDRAERAAVVEYLKSL